MDGAGCRVFFPPRFCFLHENERRWQYTSATRCDAVIVLYIQIEIGWYNLLQNAYK